MINVTKISGDILLKAYEITYRVAYCQIHSMPFAGMQPGVSVFQKTCFSFVLIMIVQMVGTMGG